MKWRKRRERKRGDVRAKRDPNYRICHVPSPHPHPSTTLTGRGWKGQGTDRGRVRSPQGMGKEVR